MANLEFCDTHNMVAYLLKTKGSKDTREVQITATIDGKIKLNSKASIRRHLKLEDSDGISTLPNTEIFEQLALMRTFNFSKMIFEGMVKNLDILALELDLQQTKKVYSTAFTKLIMKVKKLEKIVKSNKARGRAKIVVSDDKEAAEDSFKQERKIDEIDQDPDISLVQHDAELDEEERQRIARVHEEASSFNVDEWEYIQAKFEADEEIALKIQAEEKEKYSEAKKARLIIDLINKKRDILLNKELKKGEISH
nr:hypothetical protein [Tanacetum cinerariifolium]